jgi:RNA polymerase sigma-70 factor (ECF subfamily)
MPDMYSVMDDDPPRRRFEAMWAAHHPAVLAYARRRAPGEAADEVAAEAFAIAWLLGAARRVLANQRRGERRAGALLARLGAQSSVVAPDPADLIGGDRGLREAFATLSARDREVLTLVAWEGLAPREVATVLGVPAAMASARIHRARGRLRRALDARESVPAEGTP